MSKEIESVTSEELSNEALAEVQGGTVIGPGLLPGIWGPFITPPVIGPAIAEALKELERSKGPELKPLEPNPNDARTLLFF